MGMVGLEKLYNMYGHQVYRRCLVLLREEQGAMDMTQEVFIKAMGRPLGFLSESHARAWLMTVATNLSLNELRSRRYRRSEELTDLEPSPDQLLHELVEDRDLVRLILTRVDPKTAAAGVAYFLEGRTAEEISEVLGTSVPTVRRRLKKFMAVAARELASHGGRK